MTAQQQTWVDRSPPNAATHDGLATTSLICGIASFVPLTPPFITPLAAIVLGVLSERRRDNGQRPSARSSRAKAGIILGCLWLGAFTVFCIVYFWVLGYPIPHLHHYHPGG